jgi:hypothetical protein
MSTKFTLEQLTEGIRQRHLGSQNRQLVEKWSRTGLLRGLTGQNREVMSTLLENQAAQVLREQSSLGNGAGAMVLPQETCVVSKTSHSQSFVEFSVALLPTSSFQFSQ